MYIDGETLRLATYDGRVLWRVRTALPALAVTGFQQQPLVIYANGLLQIVDFTNGQPVETWRLPLADGITLASAPIPFGDELLFHTSDNHLVAVNATRRDFRWQLSDIPAFVRVHTAPQMIALLTQDHTLYLISPDGKLIKSVGLRASASFTTAHDGSLVVYGLGGLWRVDSQGAWSLLVEEAQAQSGTNAVHMTDDARLYAFDGTTLRAYAPNSTIERWAVPLSVSGGLTLSRFAEILVLTSQHGHLMAINDQGVLCGVARVYGDDRALVWQALGKDGVLRVAVGDHVIGLDWASWTAPCQNSPASN
jgi:outer membrane protein assembly factor BamB